MRRTGKSLPGPGRSAAAYPTSQSGVDPTGEAAAGYPTTALRGPLCFAAPRLMRTTIRLLVNAPDRNGRYPERVVPLYVHEPREPRPSNCGC